jgi:hypothetical protein
MDGVGASSSRVLVGVDTELVVLDGGASDSEGVVGGVDLPIIPYGRKNECVDMASSLAQSLACKVNAEEPGKKFESTQGALGISQPIRACRQFEPMRYAPFGNFVK